MTKRKSPTNSVDQQAKAVSGSFVNIKPPEHIRMENDDMPFFESVVSEFARSEWTTHALEIASILARTMADLEREQFELRKEGSIAYSEKGTPVANPRKTIVQMHASSILSLRKSLGVDARSKTPTKSVRVNKTKEAMAYEQNVPKDDGLIARPAGNA